MHAVAYSVFRFVVLEYSVSYLLLSSVILRRFGVFVVSSHSLFVNIFVVLVFFSARYPCSMVNGDNVLYFILHDLSVLNPTLMVRSGSNYSGCSIAYCSAADRSVVHVDSGGCSMNTKSICANMCSKRSHFHELTLTSFALDGDSYSPILVLISPYACVRRTVTM